MGRIDPADLTTAASKLDDMTNEDVLAALREHEGGVEGALDAVLNEMAAHFNADKAGGQQATVQFDLGTPEGERSYHLRIADGRCEAGRGPGDSPRVTIRIGAADFLRLITGKLNGMQAFMTGKLKVSGDLFFAQTFQAWFDRPET